MFSGVSSESLLTGKGNLIFREFKSTRICWDVISSVLLLVMGTKDHPNHDTMQEVQ